MLSSISFSFSFAVGFPTKRGEPCLSIRKFKLLNTIGDFSPDTNGFTHLSNGIFAKTIKSCQILFISLKNMYLCIGVVQTPHNHIDRKYKAC